MSGPEALLSRRAWTDRRVHKKHFVRWITPNLRKKKKSNLPSSPATEARLWSGLFSSHPSAPSADFFFFFNFFPPQLKKHSAFCGSHARWQWAAASCCIIHKHIAAISWAAHEAARWAVRPGLASHGGRPGGLCCGPRVAVWWLPTGS